MKDNLGVLGILILVGTVVLLFVLRRFFPALATILMVILAVAAVLIVLFVALVIFLALRKPKSKKEPGAENTDAVLAKGRSSILELRQLAMRIKHQDIRLRSQEIFQICDKILRALKEKPENLGRVRQFFNYYLPTLGGILRKYRILEESGIPESNTAEQVIACLKDIHSAMVKMYANLFEDYQLDLSVEMEVLKQMCKLDGFLTEDDLMLKSGD